MKKFGKRKEELISKILDDLRTLRVRGNFNNQYAVEQNILFFESIKSIFTYTHWLLFQARHIDREKLLELSDLPVPKWDKELHMQLTNMSRRTIPGMIAPIREKIPRHSPRFSVEEVLVLD